MDLTITPTEKLTQIVTEAVIKALSQTEQSTHIELPDRIRISEAIEITGLSKSKIYKLTMSDEIPFSKFSNKLIFSRKKLIQWLDNNTLTKTATSELVSENLMNQAKKKGRLS